jgi:hypothetical protein
MTHVYYGELQTTHFNFFAAGATEDQVRQAIRNAWVEHVKQTGADPGYPVDDDTIVNRCVLGQAYRDEDGNPLGEPAFASGPHTARIKRAVGQRK